MGTKTLLETPVCSGGNEGGAEHSGEHQFCTGCSVCDLSLQLLAPDWMHSSWTEAAGWRILSPFLVKVYAEAELLPKEKWADNQWNVRGLKNPVKKCWKQYVLSKCIWHCPVLQWGFTEPFHLLYWKNQYQPDTLPENTFQRQGVRISCYVLSAKTFFRFLGKQLELLTAWIIQELQGESGIYWGSWVS